LRQENTEPRRLLAEQRRDVLVPGGRLR